MTQGNRDIAARVQSLNQVPIRGHGPSFRLLDSGLVSDQANPFRRDRLTLVLAGSDIRNSQQAIPVGPQLPHFRGPPKAMHMRMVSQSPNSLRRTRQ